MTEEIQSALKTGRSVKVYGKKQTVDVTGNKTIVPVSWSRDGLSTARLKAAVAAAKKFPSDTLSKELAKLYVQADAASQAREPQSEDWGRLKSSSRVSTAARARDGRAQDGVAGVPLLGARARVTKSKNQENSRRRSASPPSTACFRARS